VIGILQYCLLSNATENITRNYLNWSYLFAAEITYSKKKVAAAFSLRTFGISKFKKKYFQKIRLHSSYVTKLAPTLKKYGLTVDCIKLSLL